MGCLGGIIAHFVTILLAAAIFVVCYSYPGPDNQVVTVGSQVSFTCTPTYSDRAWSMRWQFCGLNESVPCELGSGNRTLSCTYLPNVIVQLLPDGNASLTLTYPRYSSAGTIACLDDPRHVYYEAVLGIIENSPPTVTSSASMNCILEGEYIDLTCRTYYCGSQWMPLKLTWSTADGHLVSGETVNSSCQFESSITVQATRWTSFPYNCTVSFRAPTRYRLYSSWDSKAPGYRSSISTSKYDIVSCPTEIQFLTGNGQVTTSGVVLMVGDEITCSTSGRYSVHTWINLNNISDIYRGPTVNVKVTGDFNYTCSVSVSCGATIKDCSLAANITGTVLRSRSESTISATTDSPSTSTSHESSRHASTDSPSTSISHESSRHATTDSPSTSTSHESSRHDNGNNSRAVMGLAIVLALALATIFILILLLLWRFRHSEKILCRGPNRQESIKLHESKPNVYDDIQQGDQGGQVCHSPESRQTPPIKLRHSTSRIENSRPTARPDSQKGLTAHSADAEVDGEFEQ